MPDTRTIPRPPTWFLVVLALQLIVQVYALVITGVPSKYGFHMFSGKGYVDIRIVDAGGDELDFDPDLVPRLRTDTSWRHRLPEYLCRETPGAAVVTVSEPDGSRRVEC